jgi:hypothetical protein
MDLSPSKTGSPKRSGGNPALSGMAGGNPALSRIALANPPLSANRHKSKLFTLWFEPTISRLPSIGERIYAAFAILLPKVRY